LADLCWLLTFQFLVEASVIEDGETEARGFDDLALPCPTIRRDARRIVEPVSAPLEGFAEGGQQGVTGVLVAVESEEKPGCRRMLRLRDR
jgi:hypothetical protein